MKTTLRVTPTIILIIANLGVYTFTSVAGGSLLFTSQDLIEILGQDNMLVMNGWYWQLFTSMFVHVDLLHLFGNMFFLLIFGIRAEGLFSKKEFFFIYFASGLSGNLLTLLMPPSTLSAGASGAIFGMFSASAIYLGKTLGQSIMSALMYSFFLLILSAGRNVNLLAHFGGLAAGLIIGYSLAKNRKLAKWSLTFEP
ncbi:rhomboid family intramembrane serine protease [Candidatus Bathyarchaeota archaeon]|nr:rhomboid family intramembrane serine protease [Candidatus Bathyarchaeota archaeon]